MPFFSLPEAAEIRQDSKLHPNQVSREFTGDLDFEEEISARITDKAAVVEEKLLRVTTAAEWEAQSDEVKERRESIIQQWVSLLVLDSLYRSAGLWDRARECREEAKDFELTALEGIESAEDEDLGSPLPASRSVRVRSSW